ncbi:hypothetical protein LTR70_003174 [Exophiala xenobiotica]|uniref:Uncharacterized protein n=1 Tax=Lithohypha guttulata TaxID=1690604 RepID=A0ABR0KIK4_9EURO|nr:hypothetical protein LTR24_002819 [Lithohypha guttulata]KAK5323686.1 hypothetical protein LTR70_003174 [Exophiala xenobiotica]
MSTTPTTNGRVDKTSKKQSKIIVLSIPPTVLKRFLPQKESPSVASSPAPTVEEPPKLKTAASQEHTSEANSTPLPTQDAPSPGGTTHKQPPSVNGVKRSTPMPADGMLKPRGRPGPKKKPRLEDGTIDHSQTKPTTTTVNHKLGPKANTGFINANLRALDRTGTPCRKWARKGLQLKSFTGHVWELSSWRGSETSALANGTSDSSNKDVSMQSSSDQRPSEKSDAAAGSHSGDHADKMEIFTPAASSPPPVLAPLSLSLQP